MTKRSYITDALGIKIETSFMNIVERMKSLGNISMTTSALTSLAAMKIQESKQKDEKIKKI